MKTHKHIAVLILGLLTGSSAWAKFARPEYAPIERLIKNTQAFVTEHPENAHGYYTLGGIHYLALPTELSRSAHGVEKNLRGQFLTGFWATILITFSGNARSNLS